MASLFSRHIADPATSNSTIEQHWGYVERILPCTNDAGSCEYLDGVYWMHDVSMLYTFILWAVIGGVLALIATLRFMKYSQRPNGHGYMPTQPSSSAFQRGFGSAQAFTRKWLLPERFRKVFGNVTSLQVLVLAILLGYLLVFSLVGIVYKTWITPVKNSTLFNTRSGIGGFSDRVGALAYALTPLVVMLATRESILSLVTGIPYQSFNFLHRWLGRVIYIQSFIHTLGWTIVEGNFYKPQPTVYKEFIKQPYILWGIVAMTLLTFLFVFSLRSVIKLTGHEFFRKTHYVVAMIYIGSCWAHWVHLKCWMIASLGVWLLDRGLRLLRTALIHVGYLDGTKVFGFHPAQANLSYFPDSDGGVVRLEFSHNHDAWSIGQHFFLTFPALTIWQSHPLTVASIPSAHPTLPHHVYIIRCRSGETGRLKTLITASPETKTTTPVILNGPYGAALLPSVNPETTNILAIAGGTGISLTLPLVLAATASPVFIGAAVDFVWIVRRMGNLDWIATELAELKRRAEMQNIDLRIHIFVTQESSTGSDSDANSAAEPEIPIVDVDEKHNAITSMLPTASSTTSSSSSCKSGEKGCSTVSEKGLNFKITYLQSKRPCLGTLVEGFVEGRASSGYKTRVVASGPASMGRDLRSAVARCNRAEKVWRGERRFDVGLEWDDRMG